MSERTSGESPVVPIRYGSGLFCGEQDGIVDVIDQENVLVLRLTLAAAEDLAVMLDYQAKLGRERAKADG